MQALLDKVICLVSAIETSFLWWFFPTDRYQPWGACPECGPSHSQRGRRCDNEVGPTEHRLSGVAEEVRAGSGSADGASGGRGPARWAAETGWNGEGGLGTCWWPADWITAREHWQSQGEADTWTCWLSSLHKHLKRVHTIYTSHIYPSQQHQNQSYIHQFSPSRGHGKSIQAFLWFVP